jgi:hypothetical protein
MEKDGRSKALAREVAATDARVDSRLLPELRLVDRVPRGELSVQTKRREQELSLMFAGKAPVSQ